MTPGLATAALAALAGSELVLGGGLARTRLSIGDLTPSTAVIDWNADGRPDLVAVSGPCGRVLGPE